MRKLIILGPGSLYNLQDVYEHQIIMRVANNGEYFEYLKIKDNPPGAPVVGLDYPMSQFDNHLTIAMRAIGAIRHEKTN